MKTIKARYALLIAVGLLMTGLLGNVMAANYNWDGSSVTGLQPTNGVWADACWNTNSVGLGTLVTWPGDNTNNAYFAGSSATVASIVTVGGSVAVNQLGLGWNGSAKEDNCFVTLTNGTITVGAGGIIVNSGKTVLLYSDVVLATNQTWDVRSSSLPIYGSIKDGGSGYGITKIGTSALSLYSTNNTFSGGITLSGGTLNINSASAIGTGALTINSGTTLNNTTALLITNTPNNTMSWNGNFSFGGNMDLNMGTGAATLGTNVVFTEAGTKTLTVGGLGGSYGFTRTGPGILSFSGNSSFSGGLTINSGTIQSTLSGSGTPFGSSNIVLVGNGNPVATGNGATQLKLVPEVTGATSLTGGTDAGSLFSFANTAFFYLARKDASSPLTYTFGPGSGTVLSRVDKGVLVIQESTATGVPVYLGILGGNNFLISGTAPAINNGMVDAYYLGGRSGGQGEATFLTYDATYGFKPVTYDYTPAAGTLTPTGWNNTKKVKLNGTSTLNTDASVYALSVENGTSAYFTNNATLTIGDGTHVAGLLVNDAGIYGSGTINFGTSEGLIYAGNSPVIANVVAGSGGLTKAQYDGTSYKLTLTANPTYTGTTTINNGTLEFTSSAVSLGTVQGLGILQYSGAGTLNLVQSSGTLFAGTLVNASSGTMNLTLSGSDTLTTVQNTSSGTLNISATPGTNNITTLTSSGANGKMTFSGAGSVNNMGNNFCGNSASSTNVFTSGTWSFTGGGNGANQVGTLVVNGATVKFSGGRYWHSAGGTTTVTNGTLQIAGDRWNPGEQQTAGTVIQVNVSGTGLLDITYSQYGVGLGAGTVTGNGGTLVNQTGGTVQYGITPGTGTAGFLIGGNAHTNYLCAYNLSGGILRSKATITAGAWPSGSTNAFNWSGGTLVVNGITMANMASSDGVNSATSNTLFNSAGTLAPGDVGMAGLTTITGNYTETTTNAVLAVDIGGTAKGSAFQTGSYDYLNIVNGTATFSGRLSVNLINGYVPPSTRTNFTVVAATGTNPTLAGSFANVTDGKVWCSDGYSRFDVLFNTTAKTVILTNFMVNAWSPTSGNAWTTGANWSLAEANGSDMAAYFGAGASGAVTLDTARTVRGLTFNNGSASYTLSGSATLTLQGDALTTPKLSVTAGIHTISVPIALSNATEIAVAGSSMLTLAGNVTGAQAVTKTGTGTLALSAANTLGALTISAGTVRFAAGTTTASALTITAGATCDFFAGTLYILKNGGGLDTLDKVNAAITANTITLRGKNALPIDFKVTEETIDSVVYIKVTAKLKGTMIMVL